MYPRNMGELHNKVFGRPVHRGHDVPRTMSGRRVKYTKSLGCKFEGSTHSQMLTDPELA